MNSNHGKSGNQQKSSVSMNNFEFDLGLGSSRPKPLKDQKNNASSYSYSASTYSSAQSKPAWQPNKPSWTHQPAPAQAARPGLSNVPASMVGDIFGKSWGSGSSGSSSSIGIVDKNPNLFGDLVRPVLGQGKGNTNVPLKNVTPVSMASGGASGKSSYSMGNLTDSMPKLSNPLGSGSWGSSDNSGNYKGGYNNTSIDSNKGTNLGGPSIRSMGGGGVGGGRGSSKDPFDSLSGFGSKQSGSLNSANKVNKNNATGDAFGDFQTPTKSSTTTFPSGGSTARNDNFTGFNSNKMDDFRIPTKDFTPQSQPPVQNSSLDPLDSLFSSTTTSTVGATEGFGGQFSEVDAWDTEFVGGHDAGGTTTELDGLPPPPAGVTAPVAKNKGMDNYKQGQYADAIKWLSWAVILLEKSGSTDATIEVLSSRASCYKEVGEYKKAVADCSKVLEHDGSNVSVLVQRALLYESMEKYKLGADDLRTVLKIDPVNRIARSMIHRLTKMAD